MKRSIYIFAAIVSIAMILSSCMDDFLDREPKSTISPEDYLWTEEQLLSFSIARYPVIFETHESGSFGIFGKDKDTDNQAYINASNIYAPGQYKVGQSGGAWDFTNIYQLNYFLETVLPRWENGEISGTDGGVKHCIGEIYFLRAWEYFKKMQQFGDFPIVTQTFPDEMDILVEASKRAPHTEVARFILSDLDKAIELLQDESPDKAKNRLNKACAHLVKSRVALYEATWLKYFKNTAFVPNGPGWPGAEKDYNANYQFQSGSIDAEIEWLLDKAIEHSAIVANSYALTPNNGNFQQSLSETENEYFTMFCNTDMTKYSEVLLWRKYNYFGIGIGNVVGEHAAGGNYGVGLTRGYVDSFLANDGLPIYASSQYQGDDYLADVRKNRDSRLHIFLKEPDQKNILIPSTKLPAIPQVEPYPILASAQPATAYATGYTIRKGLNANADDSKSVGCILFRASEAYLNYMEAYYERYGSLDAAASNYWKLLRDRAIVNNNFNATIAATDMSIEAKNDWGAYSANVLVDATLYNIRRERRCELLAEGFREMDLRRWRSMDQMIITKYHIEGFKLWGPMQEWYKDGSKWLITWGSASASVSDPAVSGVYLRPYQKTKKEFVYDGYSWHMAHYLTPIALEHFLITSVGKEVEDSPIYQNPEWPIEANVPPIGIQ